MLNILQSLANFRDKAESKQIESQNHVYLSANELQERETTFSYWQGYKECAQDLQHTYTNPAKLIVGLIPELSESELQALRLLFWDRQGELQALTKKSILG